MNDYKVEWVTANAVSKSDEELECRQVYVWLVTSDKKIVVVSKDGLTWQLPGGKPEPEESLQETAIREVIEETGLNIADSATELIFFGYRKVEELGNSGAPYLQIRYALALNKSSASMSLSTEREDVAQSSEDTIQFVEAVSEPELLKRLSWLKNSEEYLAFLDTLKS